MQQVLPRITQIEYRELVTGPGYNNTTIGATAAVREDERPEQALTALEVWVRAEFAKRGKEREEITLLSRAKAGLMREYQQLSEAIAAQRRVLSILHGPRARLRYYQDWFARRWPRLCPATWRQDYDDLDDVPF